MNPRTEYYTKLTAKQAELRKLYPSGSLHIASVNNGRVCGASIEVAARCIIEGSHRVTSEVEVQEHEKQMALLRAQSTNAGGGIDQARALFAALGHKDGKK